MTTPIGSKSLLVMLIISALNFCSCKPKQQVVVVTPPPVVKVEPIVDPIPVQPAPKPVPVKRIVDEPDLMAFIERGECYGKCPAYLVKIYQDGRVLYNGRRNTERTGWFEAKLKPGMVEQIRANALDAGLFNLADKYPVDPKMMITDLPTCKIYVFANGREKMILDRNDSPVELHNFELYLDEITQGLNYTPTAEPGTK